MSMTKVGPDGKSEEVDPRAIAEHEKILVLKGLLPMLWENADEAVIAISWLIHLLSRYVSPEMKASLKADGPAEFRRRVDAYNEKLKAEQKDDGEEDQAAKAAEAIADVIGGSLSEDERRAMLATLLMMPKSTVTH